MRSIGFCCYRDFRIFRGKRSQNGLNRSGLVVTIADTQRRVLRRCIRERRVGRFTLGQHIIAGLREQTQAVRRNCHAGYFVGNDAERQKLRQTQKLIVPVFAERIVRKEIETVFTVTDDGRAMRERPKARRLCLVDLIKRSRSAAFRLLLLCLIANRIERFADAAAADPTNIRRDCCYRLTIQKIKLVAISKVLCPFAKKELHTDAVRVISARIAGQSNARCGRRLQKRTPVLLMKNIAPALLAATRNHVVFRRFRRLAVFADLSLPVFLREKQIAICKQERRRKLRKACLIGKIGRCFIQGADRRPCGVLPAPRKTEQTCDEKNDSRKNSPSVHGSPPHFVFAIEVAACCYTLFIRPII